MDVSACVSPQEHSIPTTEGHHTRFARGTGRSSPGAAQRRIGNRRLALKLTVPFAGHAAVVSLESVCVIVDVRILLENEKLELSAIPKIPVEAIVLIVLAEKTLRVDRAPEELETMVGHHPDLDVVHDGLSADPREGEAVDLFVLENGKPALLHAHVAKRSAVLVVVVAPEAVALGPVAGLEELYSLVGPCASEHDHASPVPWLSLRLRARAREDDRTVGLPIGDEACAGLDHQERDGERVGRKPTLSEDRRARLNGEGLSARHEHLRR